MLKHLQKWQLIILFRNLNKGLLLFSSVHLLWIFLYKFYFLSRVAYWDFMPMLGEIYYAIALSIVAGYIIYVITTEWPNINRIINYRFIYFSFIAKVNFERLKFCTIFDFSDELLNQFIDSNKNNEAFKYLDSQINNHITSKLNSDNVAEELNHLSNRFNDTLIKIKSLISDTNLSSRYLHESFYDIYEKIEILNQKIDFNKNMAKSACSETMAIAMNFCHIFNFLNTIIKTGVKDLIKYGSDKNSASLLLIE